MVQSPAWSLCCLLYLLPFNPSAKLQSDISKTNMIMSFFWVIPAVASRFHWVMAVLLYSVAEAHPSPPPAGLLTASSLRFLPRAKLAETPWLAHTPHSFFIPIKWLASTYPSCLSLGIVLSGSGKPHTPLTLTTSTTSPSTCSQDLYPFCPIALVSSYYYLIIFLKL